MHTENVHLRRQFQDTSSQLTHLENQSHSMQDVITQVNQQQGGGNQYGGGGGGVRNQRHFSGDDKNRGGGRNNGNQRQFASDDTNHGNKHPSNQYVNDKNHPTQNNPQHSTSAPSSLAGSDHENNMYDEATGGCEETDGEGLSRLSTGDAMEAAAMGLCMDNDSSSGNNDSNEGPTEQPSELDQNSNSAGEWRFCFIHVRT